MKPEIKGTQWIAGEPIQIDTKTFFSPRPLSKSHGNIAFTNANPDVINQSVRAAVEAYQVTRNYPATCLAELLDTVADEIEALGDALLETTHAETALGILRLTGERSRTTSQLRKFSALLAEGSYVEAIIDTAQPERQPNPRSAIHRMLVPLGPVAVFSASNFPYAFAVAGGDTASAWAAGCPVIVKGHPGHPETSELFAIAINNAIKKTGFPKGFFSLIQGDEIEVGQTLVRHPAITAVGFTGSLRAGRAILDTASARPSPIPVYAEMGSVNPMVLLPDAITENTQAMATGLAGSVTLGTGQFCTNPGLVFMLNSPDTDAFIAKFVEQMRTAQPGVLLNPQIENGLARAVQGTLTKDSVANLLGGNTLAGSACGFEHTVMRTTSAAFRADDTLQIEHFGPVTLFVICDSIDDLKVTLTTLQGNLTATIHATETENILAGEIANILQEKVGRLIWNGFPTGVEVVHAMQHGGPYPATTAPHTTSVGMTAIKRFMRPVAYQNMPDSLLPLALQNSNPLGIMRLVDDKWTTAAIAN